MRYASRRYWEMKECSEEYLSERVKQSELPDGYLTGFNEMSW